MLIGAMNDPKGEPLSEIRKIAGLGFQFIDFTMEPPLAPSWLIDAPAIAAELRATDLEIVGHTAYYLPFGHPNEEVRNAAVESFCRSLPGFHQMGAHWVNYHPDRNAPLHGREFFIRQNIKSLSAVIEAAKPLGIGVMVENLPGQFNSVGQLADLLDALPDIALHLDIGHANLDSSVGNGLRIIEHYGNRIRHVHLHDNKGGDADLHLPLGCGNVPWRRAVALLKQIGYDATITLEVFTPDTFYLKHSQELLREAWEGA